MSSHRNSTRARLIEAALELFTSKGVTETTTKAVAELAQVNEVTLFRHFGNKHGLLLAVIEDSAVFTKLGESLVEQANHSTSVSQALKDYASGRLQALSLVPELVRSLVGEAGQYPIEHRQALGRGLTQANRYVAEYLATVIHRGKLHTNLTPEKLASLLNGMLLGYFVIELTSEFHELWEGRDDFIENLVELFLHGAVSPQAPLLASAASLAKIESDRGEKALTVGVGDRVGDSHMASSASGALVRSEDTPDAQTLPPTKAQEKIADLPASVVHVILQRAKKLGLRDYALAYVLFGAGLCTAEIVALERSHQISENRQHLLQVSRGAVRQVPVNQWIMGKRYGSYTHNPLTQWLKSRKDNSCAMFLNEAGKPLSDVDLRAAWHVMTEGLLTPEGQPPYIEQARQTWCVEMLMRGINLEDLSILSGFNVTQLQPYARRAREKAALEQAIRLDHKA